MRSLIEIGNSTQRGQRKARVNASMTKSILGFFFLIGLSLNVKADEPPPFGSFKTSSENKEHFAWVTLNDNDTAKEDWERKWILTVYTKDSIKVWSQDYDYSGYPNGLLSDDGKYFVYVEYWYYPDNPVVDIYSQDNAPIYISGKDFQVPFLFQLRTVSHKLWLSKGRAYYFKGSKIPELIVHTRDGNTWTIDLRNGHMKRKIGILYYIIGLSIILIVAIISVILYFRRKKRIRKS